MKKQLLRLQIPTLFGLEGLTADELRYHHFEEVEAENGKVFFSGTLKDAARANVLCRYGERVLIVMGSFHAETFDELFDGTRDLPWENFIGSLDRFPVKGWSLNSALHSVPDCQKIIKKAVVEHLKECYGTGWFEETGALMQIQFSIMKDEVTLMLDTTGPGLHKRGYRANANAAPIRETLAAGMADLARVHHDTLVCDPMCGSGTILIESALKALNIAPGLKRRFMMETWGCFNPQDMKEIREEARAEIKTDVSFAAAGSDIDPSSVSLTLENARKAGVEKYVTATCKDVIQFKPDLLDREGHKRVAVICNPPYGERMLDKTEAQKLYRTMGVVMAPYPSVGYYIITPDEQFETVFGRKADKRRKLYNGMLKCQLYMYFR